MRRHVKTTELFFQRGRYLHIPLGKLIERMDEVPLTAGAVVQAIVLYAKLNARGEFVQRQDVIDVNDLIEKMTPDERRHFAIAPEWFARAIGAKTPQGGNGNG